MRETIELQKYLGMAVHFVYYHHSKLHDEKVFDDDYCSHLKKTGDKEYWEKMYKCLEYAFTQNDYCISIIDSPHKARYSDADIRLFFEKFYTYLGNCLKTY
jgi:hypothetical protein